jgi:integrase
MHSHKAKEARVAALASFFTHKLFFYQRSNFIHYASLLIIHFLLKFDIYYLNFYRKEEIINLEELHMKNETVLSWMKKWCEIYVKPNLAVKTYSCYNNAIKELEHHQPELQEMPLSEFTSLYAQNILNSLANTYAKSTLNDIRVVFHKSFEVASKIPSLKICSIGKLYIPKKASQKKVRAFTRTEQKIVEEAAHKTLLGHITVFFLRTGLRAEELCNLKWSDYNANQQIIYVRKSKTKAGIRPVPLCKEAQRILLSQCKSHFDNSIFHCSTGSPISMSSLEKLYLRLRRLTGIPFITTHVYRHTFATRSLENGMNVKALSQILGHTDVAFTIKQYCSPDVNFLREQVDKCDKMQTEPSNEPLTVLVSQQAQMISNLQKIIEQLQHC